MRTNPSQSAVVRKIPGVVPKTEPSGQQLIAIGPKAPPNEPIPDPWEPGDPIPVDIWVK